MHFLGVSVPAQSQSNMMMSGMGDAHYQALAAQVVSLERRAANRERVSGQSAAPTVSRISFRMIHSASPVVVSEIWICVDVSALRVLVPQELSEMIETSASKHQLQVSTAPGVIRAHIS